MYDQAVAIVLKTRRAVDLAGAAAAAHRLQPRRAADRADGARRAGVADADQRQPRSAGARPARARAREARDGAVAALAALRSPALARRARRCGSTQLQGFLRDDEERQGRVPSDRHRQGQTRGQKESTGTFAFPRPGKFRWTYEKPFEQLIVGDGEKVWIYDRDLNQVIVRKLDAALGATPAALLAGDNALEQHFDLAEAGSGDGLEYVDAKPRSPRHGIQARDASASPTTCRRRWSYRHVRQRDDAHVRPLRAQSGARSAACSFTPPKGADVVGEIRSRRVSRAFREAGCPCPPSTLRSRSG